jgi:hypothetical protein
MNNKNENRKIKYAKLRQAGYSSGFCTKHKDRSIKVIKGLVELASVQSIRVATFLDEYKRPHMYGGATK